MAAKSTKTKKSSNKKAKTNGKNKRLLVVESPAKARTVNRYLGSNYIVEASVGHIKDLVKVRLGVDIENGFQPNYTTIKGKGNVIKKLKQLAQNSKDVLIATDPDREGEAIAWHIAEELCKKNSDVKRVLFNEITKQGVKEGIEHPVNINEDLFMSQQARRVIDRLVGYKVSPFLSRAMLEKTTKALSAGRVQSVALRLICEREKHIREFEPIEYWTIYGDFLTDKNEQLRARLFEFDAKQIKNPEGSAKGENDEQQQKIDKYLRDLHFIRNEDQAKDLVNRINEQNYNIQKVNRRQVKRNPSPPFTTSTLQQESSRRLGFSNKKTMSIAQRLYEGVSLGEEGQTGLITYMRTDSVRLSPQAESAARDFIQSNYGKDYVPENPNRYKSKSSNIQDAHEAVRPTSVEHTPRQVKKYLKKDEAALYELIFTRFLASQMSPAIMDQTTVDVKGGEFVFRATGSVVKFQGFLKVYSDFIENNNKDQEKDSSRLPAGLNDGQPLDLKNTEKNQSFTKPKPRYTEASLVKELDELGIGRPSTYAQIVSTIIDREYVQLEKKSFMPTELGEEVNEILVKNFPDLFNVEFTATMENELDEISEGKMGYEDMLNSFYDPFQKSLKHAEEHSDIPEIPCPRCGSPMVIRVSRNGRFLGCSRYPECRGTKPLPKPEKEQQQENKEPEIAEGVTCDKCGGQMVVRQGRYGRFYGCINYPECDGKKPITTGVKCPTCGKGELVEKFSPKSNKRFWGCSRYPDCKHITRYEPVNKECPECGNYYLEIRFKKVDGDWTQYLNCPKCRANYDIDIAEGEKESS